MGQPLSCFQKAADVTPAKSDMDLGSEATGDGTSTLPLLEKAKGHYFHIEDGRKVLDGCGGAAVACLGHGNEEVLQAMAAEARNVTYVPWAFFDNRSTRALSEQLVRSTGGRLSKVYLTSSGSEAMEAAMKLGREYFVWTGETRRVNFIARQESYHGTTVGSLSMSGHVARRAPFEEMLLPNIYRVPACNPYRQRLEGESDGDFVARKAAELDEAFDAAGPGTVVAFVAEPVVGAALGCMPAPAGYFRAVRQVCDKHGALLILDEVMCGMGRTGTLHAWEQEGVVPDIQTVGKGLAGGYQPCSAVLAGDRIARQMRASEATFTHGHTFQNHAMASAAALRVQQIVQRDGLLANVRAGGRLLGELLRERLAAHPNVGDIRGRGLFWGVELVADRAGKAPFDRSLQVARRVHDRALALPRPVVVYHGQGCAGNGAGDHVMLMPAYTADHQLLRAVVDGVAAAIEAVCREL